MKGIDPVKILLWYLLIINAVGFVIMLVDKLLAKKNAWRVPEARLMLISAIGGSIGMLAGMYLFRHKTLHPKFTIGVPLILAAQVVIATLIVIWLN